MKKKESSTIKKNIKEWGTGAVVNFLFVACVSLNIELGEESK